MLHVGFGKNETNPMPRRIMWWKHKAGECDAQARDENKSLQTHHA